MLNGEFECGTEFDGFDTGKARGQQGEIGHIALRGPALAQSVDVDTLHFLPAVRIDPCAAGQPLERLARVTDYARQRRRAARPPLAGRDDDADFVDPRETPRHA